MEKRYKNFSRIYKYYTVLNENTFYYIPHDYDASVDYSVSCVKWSSFRDTLSSLPCKVMFFVDTCHSGASYGKRGVDDMTSAIKELISSDAGVVVMAAATSKERSLEKDEWGHGAFTKAVIEGLSGKADYTKDGIIEQTELELYVSKRVKELTDGNQHPTTAKPKTIESFPLVKVE